MRNLLFLCGLCIASFTWAQDVVQIKIEVNHDLTILTDVTATPDSIPHGRHLIIYKNRTLVRGSVKDGLMDGVWTVFYQNGQQKMKGRYLMGLPHGEWVNWGKTGEVKSKFQFNRGKRIGHWQGYYSNRGKAIDIIYNPNGLPDQCIQYYEDEIISLNHEYVYTNDKAQANLSYYYKNYNIFHYVQMTNGIRNGLVNTYHNNGLVWDSYSFENGKLTSVNNGHSAGGIPRQNQSFRNGNGELKKYYANGNLYSRTRYKEGLKNDSIIVYDLGGKTGGTGTFKNDLPSGKWDIYSKFHKRIFDVEVKSPGDLAFVTIYTSATPKEQERGHLLDGYKHGVWSKYNAYGELTSETSYNRGMLDGISKKYEGSKVTQVSSYAYDNKNGDFIYYNDFGEVNVKETYVSESTLDTNWYHPPEENWVAVSNEASEMHQKYLWFYPPLPGMEIVKSEKGFMAKGEGIFRIQRAIPYDYWPELIPAKFDGGNYAEKEYIRKSLTIPKEVLDKHVDGRVLLRYKVDHLGLISEVEVLKTLGFGLDEQAVSLIKSFPPISPATYNGIPIPSYIVREIDFKF